MLFLLYSRSLCYINKNSSSITLQTLLQQKKKKSKNYLWICISLTFDKNKGRKKMALSQTENGMI